MSTRLPPGTLLADTYRVIRQIGVGGMGEVYEASHARLSGRYAVKVLLGDIAARGETLQRFRREAEVTSGLRHPNIVQVLDFNLTPEGHPYLVMEYLDGIELAEEIRRVGAMPMDRVLDIVGQIASGLAAAHSHQVIHRDLKPQNMFLVKLPGSDREMVKMVDFGISKVREATTKLTMEAAILGTPQYMAPEQAQGRLDAINHRTDQFALAAITYELIAGRPAFAGASVPSILYQVVHQQPEPLARLVPDVGPAVEAVVWKALSKAQDDRFASVLAFHTELVHAVATDRQVRTVETPSPLWLPANPTPQHLASSGLAPTAGATVSPPTAQLPLTPPTAHIPQVAPTAMMVETARLAAPTASLPPAQPSPVTTLGAAAAAFPTASPARPSHRWLTWVAGSALVFAVVGGYFGVRGLRTSPPAVVPAVATPATDPPAAATPPKRAAIHIEHAPPGLKVSVDGVAKELPIELPGGADIHTLLFEAPGYHATEFHVDGMRDSRSLVLAMKPLVHGAAAATEDDDASSMATASGAAAAAKSASARKRHRRTADVITDR